MLGALTTAIALSIASAATVARPSTEPALAHVSVAPAPAQKTKLGVCPYCQNDPALMAKAGVVSHGPIAIGAKGSQAIADAFPENDWIFLETAHLRWASALGPVLVDMEERKRVWPECDRLREMLPAVPKEPKKLDPFLRLHLFAMKGEDLYARFQKILQVTDADFPESRGEGPFMGNGRFLGEKEKFEVVLHSTRQTHWVFTESFIGVTVTDSVRYHFKDLHKLIASVPAEDDLRQDRWLWPHVVHNLAHAFLAAYKHFSFDPPYWLDEGLAHFLEKEAEPESTTHDGEEGAPTGGRGPKDWHAGARKLVTSGKARTLAQLMHSKAIGDLDLDDNVVCCSMVRYLVEVQPDGFAKFLGGIKGQLDEQGYPSGRDLPGLQRRLLKECFDMTPQQFDEAWKSWLVP